MAEPYRTKKGRAVPKKPAAEKKDEPAKKKKDAG